MKSVNQLQPAYAIFENVTGLLRYVDKFAELMHALEGYVILYFKLSPIDLGHSVRRPRVYMVALRRDLLLTQDVQKICSLGRTVLSTLQRETMTAPLKDRLLPDGHVLRQGHDEVLSRRKGKAGKGQKWVKLHAKFKKQLPKFDKPLKATMDGLTPREKDIVSAKWRQSQGDETLVLDVSQSIHRCPQGSTESECPCVIPGGKIYSLALDRVIEPNELLLLHGIPLHRLPKVSENISKSDLASLAGNCMHVECVTAATLVALSCLQCDKLMPDSQAIKRSASRSLKLEPGELVCMEAAKISASKKPAAAEPAAVKKPAADVTVSMKKLRRSTSGDGKRMALNRAYSLD